MNFKRASGKSFSSSASHPSSQLRITPQVCPQSDAKTSRHKKTHYCDDCLLYCPFWKGRKLLRNRVRLEWRRICTRRWRVTNRAIKDRANRRGKRVRANRGAPSSTARDRDRSNGNQSRNRGRVMTGNRARWDGSGQCYREEMVGEWRCDIGRETRGIVWGEGEGGIVLHGV
jgi:hypothetical protein